MPPLFLDPAAQNAYIAEHNKQFGHEYGSEEMMRGSLATKETVHTREVISKFGGSIKTGSVVMIPEQTWNKNEKAYLAMNPRDYMERHQPTHVVSSAGIPGYTGHKPHNPKWSVPLRRPNLRAEHVRPHLEAGGKSDMIDHENYAPQQPHAIDRVKLDRHGWPTRMPPPGYTGHLPHTKEHCFGTSHFRDSMPQTRAQAAQTAKAEAHKRAHMFDNDTSVNARVVSAAPFADPNDPFAC